MPPSEDRFPAADLLYLFAGEVLPHPHFSLAHLLTPQHAVRLPCDGGHVTLGPLECHLVAWTLWELHDTRAVRLARDPRWAPRAEQDGWLGLDVVVQRHDADVAPQGLLAEELYRACPSGSVAVASAVKSWGEDKGVNPTRFVFLPLEAIVDLVYRDTCRMLDVESVSADSPGFDCAQVAELRPLFLALRNRWGRFADHEPQLASALVRCCDAGLAQLRPPNTAAIMS